MLDTKQLYKKIIRNVHPDINPTLLNATHKTQIINFNKNNKEELIKYGVLWGILDLKLYKSMMFKDLVRYYIKFKKTNFNGHTCLVLRQKRIGNIIHILIKMDNKKFYKYKIDENEIYKCFDVLEKSDIKAFWNTLREYQNIGTQRSYRARVTEIRPHTNYVGQDVKIRFVFRNRIYESFVINTTAKCIYVNLNGKTRRIHISKLIKVL